MDTREGLYRVHYKLKSGEQGYYAITAIDERDALKEGKRLARAAYGDGVTVTHASFLRPHAWTLS